MKLFVLFIIIWVFLTNGEHFGLLAPHLDHNHSFGKWTTEKETTESEDGVKEKYCDCGENENQDIYFEVS